MSVRVYLPGGQSVDVPSGDTFVIPDDGHLYIRSAAGELVAVFIPVGWSGVQLMSTGSDGDPFTTATKDVSA